MRLGVPAGPAGSDGAAPQHRADARQKLAQLGGLGEIVVGAELQPHDPVDRARRGGQHDDRNVAGLLQEADQRKPVLLRHVEVEHDEVGLGLLNRGAKRFSAVAEGDVEAVHLQVVADHVAGGGLVVDHEDVLLLGHCASASSRSGNAIAKTAPPAEPGLSTKMRPL